MKFKKFRKIYRILFPINASFKILKNDLIESELLKSILEKDGHYEILLHDETKVIVRNQRHSDAKVFKQIFLEEEYSTIKSLMLLNHDFNESKIIIDAGANVGYTTVYFSNIFKNAKIIAIEPSFENAEFFLKNIKTLKNSNNIVFYQNALAGKEGLNFSLDRGFRDGKDWSIATYFNQNGKIKGISLNEIICNNNLDYISFLKIDIEGAERFIFNFENDLSFLKITEIIAIEIHDEFDIREIIEKILIQYNFLIFNSGELTIGINKMKINA